MVKNSGYIFPIQNALSKLLFMPIYAIELLNIHKFNYLILFWNRIALKVIIVTPKINIISPSFHK